MGMRQWTWTGILVLGTLGGLAGCAGAGVTPEEKERIVTAAGKVAFEKTLDAAVKEGLSVAAARELALIAQKEAEDLARKSVPIRQEGGGTWEKILSAILMGALNLGLGMIKEKHS